MDKILRYYKLTIRGENFLMKINGQMQKLGFYNTRYVKAQNEEEAEHLIVHVLMNELKEQNSVKNNEYDPPRMFLEEIQEMESFKDVQLPGSGFIFHTEKSENED